MVKKALITLALSVVFAFGLYANEQNQDDFLPLYSEYRDVSVVKNEGGIFKKGRRGFHYGNDVVFKYNRVEAFKDTAEQDVDLSFNCLAFDDNLFVGYMFSDVIGLYLKMNTTTDIENFNNGYYKLSNRFGIYGKFGPRIYYMPTAYIEAEFVFGRLMYTYNWSSYYAMGCDASIGIETFAQGGVFVDFKLVFSYRRTPYSNEYGAGLSASVEFF